MSVEGLTAALIADRRLGRNRLVYVILILAKLPVKVRIVMRIHTALENVGGARIDARPRLKKWLLPNKRPRVPGLKKKVAATKDQTVTEERRAAEQTRLGIVADLPHTLTKN